jgi:hypothetical protein
MLKRYLAHTFLKDKHGTYTVHWKQTLGLLEHSVFPCSNLTKGKPYHHASQSQMCICLSVMHSGVLVNQWPWFLHFSWIYIVFAWSQPNTHNNDIRIQPILNLLKYIFSKNLLFFSFKSWQRKFARLNIYSSENFIKTLFLHEDLGIPFMEDEIKRLATRYLNKLPAHNSDQVRQLNNPLTERRRLKRRWPTDLSLA